VGWPLVCEGVEAGGEGDGGDWVHGWRFAGWWFWGLKYVLDASCSVGVEGDPAGAVLFRVVALRLLRLTYAGRSPPVGFLYRSMVHPRTERLGMEADCHSALWSYS
jgi:hypothetical protein